MRATGLVPWSGMNIACGICAVDPRTFWLTTAAGTASWSYITASVGEIASRLPLSEAEGESLTALLRDPGLVGKLVFLTGLSLLPVLLKRREGHMEEADQEEEGSTRSSVSDEEEMLVTPPNETDAAGISGEVELVVLPKVISSPSMGTSSDL